jgi:hypothetical protein
VAKGISFNFGANAKPRKPRSSKSGKGKGKGGKKRTSSGTRNNNAWRSYVGISNAPIPD